MRIAVLGGTGPEGLGIAARLAAAGESVVIGSRSAERAVAAAQSLRTRVPKGDFSGAANRDAAADAEIVFIVVPYEGVDHILETCGAVLPGKIIVDTIINLRVTKGFFEVDPIPEGSAAERIQKVLPGARVVSAFKHQSAKDLMAVDRPVEGDVLVCGNDPDAKRVLCDLVKRIPDLRPVDAGELRIARVLEPMTALLLNLNHQYKTRASYRILGL